MSGVTLFPLVGDGFQPRLSPGSGLLVTPVDRYQFDGIYTFKDGAAYFAYRRGKTVDLWLDTPRYSRHEVPLAWFNDNVAGMAVAEVNVRVRDFGRHILPPAEMARAAAEQAIAGPPALLESAA